MEGDLTQIPLFVPDVRPSAAAATIRIEVVGATDRVDPAAADPPLLLLPGGSLGAELTELPAVLRLAPPTVWSRWPIVLAVMMLLVAVAVFWTGRRIQVRRGRAAKPIA